MSKVFVLSRRVLSAKDKRKSFFCPELLLTALIISSSKSCSAAGTAVACPCRVQPTRRATAAGGIDGLDRRIDAPFPFQAAAYRRPRVLDSLLITLHCHHHWCTGDHISLKSTVRQKASLTFAIKSATTVQFLPRMVAQHLHEHTLSD